MSDPHQRPVLTAEALQGLQQAKEQIVDAAAGKLPEQLVLATVESVVRLGRREAALGKVLPARVAALVRTTLKALAQQPWKPDTALRLRKRGEEGGHELR